MKHLGYHTKGFYYFLIIDGLAMIWRSYEQEKLYEKNT